MDNLKIILKLTKFTLRFQSCERNKDYHKSLLTNIDMYNMHKGSFKDGNIWVFSCSNIQIINKLSTAEKPYF